MDKNWNKYGNVGSTTRAIMMNKEKSNLNNNEGSRMKKYPTSLFLKFGNSNTNPYNAVDTISIYKDFSYKNGYVWISTDSLSRGMSQQRIDEFNNAIINNKLVELYLIPSKTSKGNNEITHKARVIEIQGDKNRMTSPDTSLTPQEWVYGLKMIWIKVGKIRPCYSKKATDFIVISSNRVLADSISNSQYNFGYIEEI